MKICMLAAALLTVAVPVSAQFGGLGGALKKAQASKQAIDELTITADEERQIGNTVSEKIRARFGVVQDEAIHRYVSLIGTTLAKQSERPDLDWTFIVLDTDGVNAFASPGGLVHITRGALALAKNEAEVAGVIGHEIGHVARKHTVNAIKKGSAVQIGAGAAASRASLLSNYADRAYEMVLENSFDRADELDADGVGVQLSRKAGYAAASLGNFLTRIDERNQGQEERNGMFASHPETKERIEKVRQLAGGVNAAVFVEARFKSNVTYQPTPITSIAVVTEGSAGLEGSAKAEPKKEEPKKKGFGLGGLTQTVAPEKQSTQVSASGGARGLGNDRTAKGGSNPSPVKVRVSAGEVDAFKRGIA